MSRTEGGRVQAVLAGKSVEEAYGLGSVAAAKAYRHDLKELAHRPTHDAFMAACRALHWRTAQLRAAGIEPIDLSRVDDLTHYPPERFDFANPYPLKGEVGSREWKVERIKLAANYNSDQIGSCNALYMGSMATCLLFRALGGDWPNESLAAVLERATEDQLDAGLEQCKNILAHIDKRSRS